MKNNRKGFGYGVNGAMTKFVKFPHDAFNHVPAHLPFEQAYLTEPCSVAYNAVVNNAHIKPGDRVIVIGSGTIGILCAAPERNTKHNHKTFTDGCPTKFLAGKLYGNENTAPDICIIKKSTTIVTDRFQ